jgi:hypothetical protein
VVDVTEELVKGAPYQIIPTVIGEGTDIRVSSGKEQPREGRKVSVRVVAKATNARIANRIWKATITVSLPIVSMAIVIVALRAVSPTTLVLG